MGFRRQNFPDQPVKEVYHRRDFDVRELIGRKDSSLLKGITNVVSSTSTTHPSSLGSSYLLLRRGKPRSEVTESILPGLAVLLRTEPNRPLQKPILWSPSLEPTLSP